MTLLIASESEDQTEAITFKKSLEEMFKPALYSGVINPVIVDVSGALAGDDE
jgi:hypothetical protein